MHLADQDRLDGHDAIEALLAGAIDDAHSALGNQVENLISRYDLVGCKQRLHDVDFDRIEQPAAPPIASWRRRRSRLRLEAANRLFVQKREAFRHLKKSVGTC